MNPQILIHAIVQQTMVFIAQLATAGGVRAPLMRLANQTFLDLSEELRNQGVRKNVIADMFGMTLRTYHRKVRELSQSQSVEGRSLWEAMLEYLRERDPVTGAEVYAHFSRDDRDVVTGVLGDLVNSGIASRSGRGNSAVYRIAEVPESATIDADAQATANKYLVWQAIYRSGPATIEQLSTWTHLSPNICKDAVSGLLETGDVQRQAGDGEGVAASYASTRLDVPVGQAAGWEAAVFDHFQAMVSAISAKLASGDARAERQDHTGGATYSLDFWPGHPLEAEITGTLARVRETLEELRDRVDRTNLTFGQPTTDRLVFYMGQYVKSDRPSDV